MRSLPDREIEILRQRVASLERELAEARRGEATLRALVAQASDFVLTVDRDGRLLTLNRSVLPEPPEQLIGTTVYDYVAATHHGPLREALQRVIANGELQQIELPAVGANGSQAWYCGRLSPIIERGQRVAVLISAADITGLKASQQEQSQLDRKREQTQRLERLGILAGGIAHDFNNLLTAILSNAGLAAAELSSSSPARGCLEQIERASQRAADLCQQLLAYSGRGQFVIEPLDINLVVRDVLPLLQLSLPPGVEQQFESAEGLPPVLADVNRLRQVIMNLVVNAAEAVGEQPGQVSVRSGLMRADRSYLDASHLSPDLAEGDYVFLEVSDTGCGMTEEVQARLFDPFFTTKFTGRGLGLSAVLGIVRAHRGAIRIDSERGRGTTVRVLLPPTQEPATRTPRRPAARPEGWRGRGLVLVVDDEEIVLKVVGRLLQGLGFEVLLAADGNQALDHFHKHADVLRLVLLDLTMPRLDGEETFRVLHLLRPDLPVVLMSGYSEQEATGRFAGKGLAGFLQKPFTRQQVIDQLRAVLPA